MSHALRCSPKKRQLNHDETNNQKPSKQTPQLPPSKRPKQAPPNEGSVHRLRNTKNGSKNREHLLPIHRRRLRGNHRRTDKKFSATYENIYTFCLSDSVASNDDSLSCNWLVAMSDKASGNVRVGCGQYHWHFDNEANGLADALIITIEQMLVLTPESADQVLGWVSKLPYPWCESATMFQTMPPLDALTPIKEQMIS